MLSLKCSSFAVQGLISRGHERGLVGLMISTEHKIDEMTQSKLHIISIKVLHDINPAIPLLAQSLHTCQLITESPHTRTHTHSHLHQVAVIFLVHQPGCLCTGQETDYEKKRNTEKRERLECIATIMVPDKAAGYLFSLFANKSTSMAKILFVDADAPFPLDVNKSVV